MELMSKIGDYLHDWRISQRLTKQEAAKLLCCSDTAIRNWEANKTYPTYDCIRMIHEVTGADWEDLF